ncbi:sarcosine oxidase subunit gamma [Salinicola socius]|uniref:Sarcosine oxidase subunit gamma n=1 Tax=Salinicola socius TaxID=404433 RepID=A0A1Q8SRB1_9GAMM|nr:sarcosine oxidase subunit gamma family protein [Salinicola socius]OLO03971.1 sarcosine oxidase subunit gamma [Salinicola socius]
MPRFAYFDPHPARAVTTQSPLHQFAATASGGESSVVLRENAFLDHLILRGESEVLIASVQAVLGLALPTEPQRLVMGEAGSLQWLSPDEWLLIVAAGEGFRLQRELREALGSAHFSIVDVSGGQTLLELDGACAVDVLMKSTAYDVDPRAFPVGRGVTSVFAKATAVIRRVDEQRWELVIRRSFADYCLRWLLDAGEEYGIDYRPAELGATISRAAVVDTETMS